MPSAALVEKNKEFAAKQKEVQEIFAAAKTDTGEYNFSKVDSLEGDTQARVEAMRTKNVELDSLMEAIEQMVEMEAIDAKATNRIASSDGHEIAVSGNGGMLHPEPGANGKEQQKSLMEMFGESNAYKAYQEGKVINVPAVIDVGFKTLFQTTAGWAPESLRIPGLVIEAVTRPIQILQLIPMDTTPFTSIVYMEETTRTHAAAERAEAAAFAEATFIVTEKTSPVRSIGTSIPVTDEQLEDVSASGGYLDDRLRFGLMQRLDNQVLNGDGVAPNLTGILNTTGILTQAKGADPVFDAIFKAMVKVRLTGRANPTATVIHPNDWQDIRLTRTTDGLYILGNPADPGPDRLWGVPVAQSDAIAENTALTGDFAIFSRLYERRGIIVKVSDSHSTFFVEGKQMIRAEMRDAFVVFRPAAFATITGI